MPEEATVQGQGAEAPSGTDTSSSETSPAEELRTLARDYREASKKISQQGTELSARANELAAERNATQQYRAAYEDLYRKHEALRAASSGMGASEVEGDGDSSRILQQLLDSHKALEYRIQAQEGLINQLREAAVVNLTSVKSSQDENTARSLVREEFGNLEPQVEDYLVGLQTSMHSANTSVADRNRLIRKWVEAADTVAKVRGQERQEKQRQLREQQAGFGGASGISGTAGDTRSQREVDLKALATKIKAEHPTFSRKEVQHAVILQAFGLHKAP